MGHPLGMPQYEVHVRGRLDPAASSWFECLDVRRTGPDEAYITGHLVDQSALHGVLERIRDLNLELLSLRRLSA
jgi:hypothetical protein